MIIAGANEVFLEPDVKNGVLFKCITDENNNLKYTFSRFDGNSFVLENFRYENKKSC